MTNEQSSNALPASPSPSNSTHSNHEDINSISPVEKNSKHNLYSTINTSHADDSTCSSASLSPVSEDVKVNKLKREREISTESTERLSPPSKTVKMGYSIMNLLSSDKIETKTKCHPQSNKENNSSPPPAQAPDSHALPSQQSQNLNPFLLNPFLAAAAAAANQANPSANPLLNNISNFALLSNLKQQNPNELWPWLTNMAALSALYGLDKGYPNLFPSINENTQQQQQLLLQQQQQQQQMRMKSKAFMFAQSESNDRQSPNDLHLQIANNLMHQSSSSSSASTTSDSNELLTDESRSNKTSTPHLNQQSNRFNNQPPRAQQQIQVNSSPRYLADTKMMNRSFDEERDEKNGRGGASMGDDDDLDDDNLDEDNEDIDGSNNGDSFDNMRKKKTRTVFSRNQVFQLESTFDMKRYLSSSERSTLANSLQLTETQIKIWFQNRRNKWKRQLAAEIESNGSLPQQQQVQGSTPQTTQHQLVAPVVTSAQTSVQRNSSNSSNNNTPSSSTSSSSQRVIRVPVLYPQAESAKANSYDLDSSSHSSTQTSPTSAAAAAAAAAAMLNNMAAVHAHPNQNSASMLAAAAAASSLYYAAAASSAAPSVPFPSLNLNLSNSSVQLTGQSIKQTLSGIL